MQGGGGHTQDDIQGENCPGGGGGGGGGGMPMGVAG